MAQEATRVAHETHVAQLALDASDAVDAAEQAAQQATEVAAREAAREAAQDAQKTTQVAVAEAGTGEWTGCDRGYTLQCSCNDDELGLNF